MNYKLIYEQLVTRGQERPELEGYKERHHIIPRCMGGSDEKENLVDLTAEEHYVAHQLLVKMHPENHLLVYAAHCLSKITTASKNHWGASNKKYGWLRKRHSEIQKTGKVLTCKCGKEHYVAKYRLKRYKNVYCSAECSHMYAPKITEHITFPCLQCGENVKPRTKKYFEYHEKKGQPVKFCSQSCRSTYRNTHKTKVPRITFPCLHCGENVTPGTEAFFKRKERNGNPVKFCSHVCHGKAMRGAD
jgi:ribosomal protein L24E